MKRLRLVFGYLAIIGLAIGLNILVFKRDPFSFTVLAPLCFGAISGLAWFGVTISRAVESIERGKTFATINTIVAAAAFLGICIVLFAFAKHGGYSWDLTEEGRKPLSDQTIQILQCLDQDVAVFGLFLGTGDKRVEVTRDKTRRFLERCGSHTNKLTVEFFDPQMDPLKFKSLGLDRVSEQGTVVVKCGSNQKVIMLSGVTARLEERDFTNALINVVRQTKPKLCFLTGHGEVDMDNPDPKTGMSELKKHLEAEAYEISQFTINAADPRVPQDCDVVILNGPATDLQVPEIQALQDFLDRGGRMMVLVEPWRITRAGVENFRPWLKERYGIDIGTDIILYKSQRPQDIAQVAFIPDFGMLGVDDPSIGQRGSYSDAHPITRGFDMNMAFFSSRSVTLASEMPAKVVGDVILRTLPGTWAESNLDLLFDEQKADVDPVDKTGPFGVAVAVAAKTDMAVGDSQQTRDARVVVVGDQDFARNEKIILGGHLNFVMNSIAWLAESEELIAIRPTGKEDPPLVLSDTQERAVAWVAVMGSLQVIIAVGLIVYGMRRKYQ